MEAYDIGSDTWDPRAKVRGSRAYLQSVAMSGRIYAIGGGTSYRIPALDVVEEYNPTTNIWRSGTVMPQGRNFSSAVSLNSPIYVIGGWSSCGTWDGSVLSYDAGEITWKKVTTRRGERVAAAALSNNSRLRPVFGRKLYPCNRYNNLQTLILLQM